MATTGRGRGSTSSGSSPAGRAGCSAACASGPGATKAVVAWLVLIAHQISYRLVNICAIFTGHELLTRSNYV